SDTFNRYSIRLVADLPAPMIKIFLIPFCFCNFTSVIQHTKLLNVIRDMQNTNRKLGVIASFVGALTIHIGAYGAHGLKELVDEQAIASFETGVRYQMYHVFVLLLLAFAIPLADKHR